MESSITFICNFDTYINKQKNEQIIIGSNFISFLFLHSSFLVSRAICSDSLSVLFPLWQFYLFFSLKVL